MWQWLKVNNKSLNYPVDLIYDSVFQGGDGGLDYLHLVRQRGFLNIPRQNRVINTLAQSKERYEQYLPELLESFSDFCRKNQFRPDAVIRPPTNRPELQKPVFDVFLSLFPQITDLSKYLVRNPGGQGIDKFSLSKDSSNIFKSARSLFIIDDVYGEGHTIASVISRLGKPTGVITICPLLVERDSENEYVRQLRSVNLEELIRRRRQVFKQ